MSPSARSELDNAEALALNDLLRTKFGAFVGSGPGGRSGSKDTDEADIGSSSNSGSADTIVWPSGGSTGSDNGCRASN
jgi:hypothetical protein